MQGKDDDRELDNWKIKINIFILLIRFNHFTCNASSYSSSQNKRVAHYCRLCAGRWKKRAQQTYSSELM
jgi:hypothetical protein